MKSLLVKTVVMAGLLALPFAASAQYRNDAVTETSSESQLIIEQAKTSETPIIITLEQALQIALSENVSVKVADMEIERTGYAKKGAYASLFPQIDMTGAYQRTIKKHLLKKQNLATQVVPWVVLQVQVKVQEKVRVKVAQ